MQTGGEGSLADTGQTEGGVFSISMYTTSFAQTEVKPLKKKDDINSSDHVLAEEEVLLLIDK